MNNKEQAIGLNFLPEASARKYSPEEMAADVFWLAQHTEEELEQKKEA